MEIGDEKLRKHAKKVEKFDLRLRILLKDMADTMYKAQGVGLAAPQVGFLARALCHEIDHLDGVLYVDKMVRELFPEEEDGGEEEEK